MYGYWRPKTGTHQKRQPRIPTSISSARVHVVPSFVCFPFFFSCSGTKLVELRYHTRAESDGRATRATRHESQELPSKRGNHLSDSIPQTSLYPFTRFRSLYHNHSLATYNFYKKIKLLIWHINFFFLIHVNYHFECLLWSIGSAEIPEFWLEIGFRYILDSGQYYSNLLFRLRLDFKWSEIWVFKNLQ